jgi:hypothetical protein
MSKTSQLPGVYSVMVPVLSNSTGRDAGSLRVRNSDQKSSRKNDAKN